MRFLLDENLGVQVQRFIQSSGHECVRASSALEKGASDSAVYQYCLQHNYSLITRDHQFSNPVRFPPGEGFGIILIRHGNLKTSEEIQLLQDLFRSLKTNDPKGKLVIVSKAEISYLSVK